jgi:hypothetical protein
MAMMSACNQRMEVCTMPLVFSYDRRRIGSIKASRGGTTAAWNCHHKRIGTFVSVDLTITALMDIADRPLEPQPWTAWIEAILKEGD